VFATKRGQVQINTIHGNGGQSSHSALLTNEIFWKAAGLSVLQAFKDEVSISLFGESKIIWRAIVWDNLPWLKSALAAFISIRLVGFAASMATRIVAPCPCVSGEK